MFPFWVNPGLYTAAPQIGSVYILVMDEKAKYQYSGVISANFSFSAGFSIPVCIVERTSEGFFKIEGARMVEWQGNKEVLKVSGYILPAYICGDRISARFVKDLKLTLEGGSAASGSASGTD